MRQRGALSGVEEHSYWATFYQGSEAVFCHQVEARLHVVINENCDAGGLAITICPVRVDRFCFKRQHEVSLAQFFDPHIKRSDRGTAVLMEHPVGQVSLPE